MGDAIGGSTAKEVQRRRSAALRALAEQRQVRGAVLDEAVRVFGGERELVLAAQQRWQVSLLARLDQVVERNGGDAHGDVLEAVAQLGRALPGLAAVLRDHRDDPALAPGWSRLAGYVDSACPCGRGHPLLAPAPAVDRSTESCAVRRAAAAVAGWAHRLLAAGNPTPSGRRAFCMPVAGA
jgi:hypothetical protein